MLSQKNMNELDKMSHFLVQIYQWFDKNKRRLPWRETTDPYKIWLSEIILQQTRVNQGMNYYLTFIENFPTVHRLAEAPEDKVLKLWQGLGYYSRARNLHITARHISTELNGQFPENYPDILKLKGVGPYTAAAIASIAFGLPCPAVDGNIYRVLARIFDISIPIDSGEGKKEFYKLAGELIPDNNPGLHNQALMEFGALQCVPKMPNCSACPVSAYCLAYSKNRVKQLPVKNKKTKQRNRYFYYFFIDLGDFTFLEKREENDIWKNLYQFPLAESARPINEKEIIKKLKTSFLNDHEANLKSISPSRKHILSHQVIYAKLVHIEIKNSFSPKKDWIRVPQNEITGYAVPRLMEKLIAEIE